MRPEGRAVGSCEGHGRLLRFSVCWDAAVCALCADGFFCVLLGVRKRTTDAPSFRPVPLEFLRA